jgi:hypothetical protein
MKTYKFEACFSLPKRYGSSGQAAWTIHHVQNHTLLGHSPLDSQAVHRVGPAL